MNNNLANLSKEIHQGFIQHVESYRDRKIKVPKDERYDKLYQGDIWTGKEAVELGYLVFLQTNSFIFISIVLLMVLELSKRFWKKNSLMPN